MQIASFILVNDRRLHHFETQIEAVTREMVAPNAAFVNLVPMKLREIGAEHPISIPLSSLFPLDQAAGRQQAKLLSVFEDPDHPSRLGRMAQAVNLPLYYVNPGRVRDFVNELESLHLTTQIRPEDVQSLLGKRISREELPAVTQLVDQFRHDLYQVYRDAADAGKGVVVLVVSQPDVMTSEEGFPRAA